MAADDWIKHGFYNYGTQYYIAARLAARARLNPVHGNQFHHAVELYLKAALLGTLSLAQMANKPYGHDLPALWEEFKKKEGDPKPLARFDSTIRDLHPFESIRYPDKIAKEGAVLALVWRLEDLGPVTGTMKMPPQYKIVIAEVDQLVIEVLDRVSLNPKAFVVPFHNAPGMLDALTYENPQAARWV